MRIKGAKTNIECWLVVVKANNQVLMADRFTTLKLVAKELGLTYNVVVEIVNERRKQRSGTYDTQYSIKRLADCNEGIDTLGGGNPQGLLS